MFDCVLVIQTIHLMIWCLRFTSPNKEKKRGTMKEKENLLDFLQFMHYVFLLTLGNE